jgi:putative SOS response-associated peptidase YedK
MCGRYYIADEEEIIEMREIIKDVNRRYVDRAERAAMKTGEIFPTNVAPVLIKDRQVTHASLMTWGFPRWQSSGVVINARAETVNEKPLFRASLSNRRCIVPSNGFYEWDHQSGKAGDKYLIRLPATPMLYMAGLYREFKDDHGSIFTAFVIITTAANATVSTIHNRMPLVLEQGQTDQWLLDEQFARTILVAPCAAAMTLGLIRK